MAAGIDWKGRGQSDSHLGPQTRALSHRPASCPVGPLCRVRRTTTIRKSEPGFWHPDTRTMRHHPGGFTRVLNGDRPGFATPRLGLHWYSHPRLPSAPQGPTQRALSGLSHPTPCPLGFRPRVLCCSGTGTWAIYTASPMWWPLTPGWPFGSITGLPCDLFRPAVLNIRHGTRVQHQTQHRRFHADSNLAPRFMTIKDLCIIG